MGRRGSSAGASATTPKSGLTGCLKLKATETKATVSTADDVVWYYYWKKGEGLVEGTYDVDNGTKGGFTRLRPGG